MKGTGQLLIQLEKRSLLLPAPDILRTLVLYLNAGSGCKHPDSLWKADMLHLHDKVKHAAMFLTSEAVIASPLHVELAARSSLIAVSMKRTAYPVIAVSLDDLRIGRHNISYAEFCLDLLNCPV